MHNWDDTEGGNKERRDSCSGEKDLIKMPEEDLTAVRMVERCPTDEGEKPRKPKC